MSIKKRLWKGLKFIEKVDGIMDVGEAVGRTGAAAVKTVLKNKETARELEEAERKLEKTERRLVNVKKIYKKRILNAHDAIKKERESFDDIMKSERKSSRKKIVASGAVGLLIGGLYSLFGGSCGTGDLLTMFQFLDNVLYWC